jgi:D-serine deaminase-like pyridoxal phosphate-dependent protein
VIITSASTAPYEGASPVKAKALVRRLKADHPDKHDQMHCHDTSGYSEMAYLLGEQAGADDLKARAALQAELRVSRVLVTAGWTPHRGLQSPMTAR